MKILVTGACGFIGSHLVEKLVKENHNVRAFTFYNSRNSHGWLDNVDKKILKDLNLISGDIRDYNFLHQHTKKIDVIIHLAALIGIPYSYHAVKSYIDTNITGTYNVLNSAKINNVSKTIITSTSEVYGTAQKVPILENHPLSAQSPYAASKIAADQLAISYYKSFEMPVKLVRPFNTYGPRMRVKDGRAVCNFICQAEQGENITIYGDGSQTRSFCYVDDLVIGIIKLIYSGENMPVNLGNPTELSILDLAKLVLEKIETKSQIVQKPLPEDDPKVRQPDITRAKNILEWEPVVPLDEGLVKTIDYFSKILKGD